ncbi:Putative glycosyltransferase 2, nucleotide-diphospho-sugar transferase [Septoria linicola]|uniref:Glycosyltransferase 2, nucleotide-diphospho-sugar transferase n=1 Tax=Septoria linicola TaxID=215465 RepID=A0A9Q9B5A1_9PEZI|nr:putative glycosyltransferase 2, nucleotide-diphospho-sugar transferase [Septoria linicola]USW57411.1 Putative glycosyltransferase 2, nucleotide-diphospho-sugar transferase [Septoria linicola]
MFNLKNVLPVTQNDAARPVSQVSKTSRKSVLSSATSSVANGIRVGTLAFSDWLLDTTPFFLVSTYFVVTTAIFCFCNESAIKVFYFFYMSTNFYIAACCVIESFLGLTPVRDARKAAMAVEASGQFPSDINGKVKDLPTIDLVIVAYLPNEQEIIRNQVLYACEELLYPKEKLRINLVYNTPKAIEPLESELAQLPVQYKNLRVIKVPGSKSKADNLNYFFSLRSDAEVIGIFDSDHCPHPHNPRWAAERFLADSTVDIVQGRCIVYNTNESFWAKMIAIEFDKIYAISHPGRSRMFGFGLFCGSNGYWKAPLLREHKMHGDMLTEDIDSALRAYGKGKRAVHDMNVCSFEMAPNTFQAFWKQRLRWAQGWTQASWKHKSLVWGKPPAGVKRDFDERYGLASLLAVREISYYLVTMHTCLLLSFIIVDWPSNVTEFVTLLFFRYPMAEWFLFATIIALLYTLYFTEKVRSEFTSWKSMVVFCIIYVPYLILMATMGLYGHARQTIRYSSWNPTARK